MGDVRILLASHAHSDHVAEHALLKERTGAKVYVMEDDVNMIATGGAGQYLYDSRWKPCAVDRVLRDGDKVSLGGIILIARKTPGHTRGCTTWLMDANAGGKVRRVVIVGSPNVNPGYQLVNNSDYPEIADDFSRTFRILKSTPCEIFLGAHGNYYGMEAKFRRLTGSPSENPFVDPEGYKAYVAEREASFLVTLDRQRK